MTQIAPALVLDDRFRAAVETMIDCFGIYRAVRDEQGRIRDFRCEYVNEAACRSNQLTREQQVGRNLCDLLPGHRESGLFDEYCRVVELRAPLAKEMLVYTDVYGGQVLQRAFDVRVTPLEDGFASAWRDVTERRQTEERLRLLAGIGAALASSLSLEETLRSATGLAVPALADACAIHLFEPGGALRLLAVTAADPAVEAATRAHLANVEPATQNWAPIAAIVETGRPYLLSAPPPDAAGVEPPPEGLGFRSAILLPLVAHERRLGILSLGLVAAGRQYQAADIPFAEEVGRRIALALENARLYTELAAAKRQAEARAHFLDAASRALAASLDYEATLATVAGLAVPALADICLVHLIAEDGSLYDVGSACADPKLAPLLREMLDRYPPEPTRSPGLAEVLAGQEVLLKADLPPDLPERSGRDAHHAGLIRRIGPRAFLTAPLLLDGQAIGLLQLVLTAPGRSYQQDDVTLVEELARRCGRAIERARLYRAEQEARARAEQEAARTRRLLTVAEALSRPLTPGEAAAVVLEASVAALEAFAGGLFLLDGERRCFELVAAVGYPAELVASWQRFPVDTPVPIADALHAREPLWVESLAGAADRYPAFVAAVGGFTGAVAVIPLVVDGEVIGGLGLSFDRPHVASPEDRAFALALAQQCAQVLARAQLDSALRASEGRYRTLVRNFPNGTVLLFDQQLRYLIAGGANLAHVGMRPEELEGRTIWECLPPDIVAVAEPFYRSILAGTAPPEIEQRYGRRTYRTIPIVIPGDDGEAAGMIISIDITDAKEAEAALIELNSTLEQRVAERTRQLARTNQELADEVAERRRALAALHQSEAKLRLMLEQIPSLLWTTDEELRITSLLGAGRGLMQQDLSAVRGRTLTEALARWLPDPAAGGRPLEAHRRALAGASARYELEVGGLHLEVRVEPLRESDERIVGCIALATDVTARQRAAEALQGANSQLSELTAQLTRSRNLLQAVFDGLPDGLVLLDHAGTVLAANQPLAELLGLPLGQLLRRSWAMVCSSLNPPCPVSWVLESLRSGRGERRRVRYTLAHGSARVLDVHTLPLPASGGLPPQLIVRFTDSTERLQLETIAIQSERYIASGTLAAMVAHEVNTPLQAVKNFLYLIGDAGREDRQHFIALAREELRRMAEIVRQLLDLYRPMTGAPAPVDLNALIARVLLLTRVSCERQGVRVVAEPAPGLPSLWGRADQLVQLILNLVVNALDAMPHGGTLTIASAVGGGAEGEGEATIELTVSDTGGGIAAAAYPSIFEPFFTTKPGGTGLGLAICRTIAAQHGGTVTATAPTGGGATFVVALPRTSPPGPAEG